MADRDIFAGFIGMSSALCGRHKLHTCSSIRDSQRFGSVWSTPTAFQRYLALKQLPSETALRQSQVPADFTPFAEVGYCYTDVGSVILQNK